MSKSSLLSIAIRFAAIVLAVAAACLLAAGCAPESEERKQYEAGVEHYNNGEYELAKECFIAADGYGNTNDFLAAIAECENRYEDAVKKMDEHQYAEAYVLFESISTYSNSAEFMERISYLKAKYEQGLKLYDESKFIEARAYFADANGYSESDAYIANIDTMAELFNSGMEYKNAGDYENAITAFRAINADFEGAFALIEECAAELVKSPVSLNGFIKNYNDEYPGGSVSIGRGDLSSQFVLSDSQGILITGVANEQSKVTFISFWFSPGLMEELGENGYNEAIAHCIRALNPYFAEYEQILANLSGYLGGIVNYGCMNITTLIDQSGSTVVEAAVVTES